MHIKFNTCRQSKDVEDSVKGLMYHGVHTLANKCRFVAILLTPVVAITSALITLATRIALVAESIFKGLINILGCPFAKRCSFKCGLKQLIGSTIKNLAVIPFTLIAATLTLISIPLYLILDIRGNSYRRWVAHDKKEKQKVEAEQALADQIAAAEEYQDFLQIVGEETNDIANLLNLADLALKSNLENNQTLAYGYHLRAAQQDDLTAIRHCAYALENGVGIEQDIGAALNWNLTIYRLSPLDHNAIIKCAEIYRRGFTGTPPNLHTALQYYEIAASEGDIDSMVALAEIYCLGGNNFGKDFDKGIEWFREAAARHDRYAKRCLAGIIIGFADRVKKSPDLTLRHARTLKFYAKLGLSDEEYTPIEERATQFIAQLVN